MATSPGQSIAMTRGRGRGGGRGRGRVGSRGRQKIEIKKMTKVPDLHVTFSKRRMGVFNKACELCTLCATEVAIIIFSPGNKVYVFGHPSFESVMDRYMNMTKRSHTSRTIEFVKSSQNESTHDLNTKLVQILEELNNEKNKRMTTNMILEQLEGTPVSEMTLEQLDEAQAAIDKVMPILDNLSQKFAFQSIVTNEPPHFYTDHSRSNANIAFNLTQYNGVLAPPLGTYQGLMNNPNLMSEQDRLFPNNPIVAFDHAGVNHNSNVFPDGRFRNNPYFVPNNGVVVPNNPNMMPSNPYTMPNNGGSMVPYNPNMMHDNPYIVPNNGGNVVPYNPNMMPHSNSGFVNMGPYLGSIDNSNVMTNNGGFVNNLNFGSNNGGFTMVPNQGFIIDPSMMFGEGFVHDQVGRDGMF